MDEASGVTHRHVYIEVWDRFGQGYICMICGEDCRGSGSPTTVETQSYNIDGALGWVEDGCDVSPSCLDCPLPVCRYDDPRWYVRYRQQQQDLRLAQLMKLERLGAVEVAEKLGITVRTVYRARARLRKAGLL